MTILLYEQRDDVAWLTMNRPEVRNALGREMVGALRAGIERACADDTVRAIVIAGADPVFCAGANISEYKSVTDRDRIIEEGGALYDLTDYMACCEKPIIGRVQRAAFGGAVGLVAACDMAVAADDTRFSLSEVRLGIVPAVISQALLTSIGPRHARELLLRAQPFDAATAMRVGLIQTAVPADQLDEVVAEWCGQLRAGAPGALAQAKALFHDLTHGDLSPAERRERIVELAAERRLSAEAQEGLGAFLEKRRPAWNPE
jgi:methylglutaconyl-CoA hydratase